MRRLDLTNTKDMTNESISACREEMTRRSFAEKTWFSQGCKELATAATVMFCITVFFLICEIIGF